MKKTLITTLFAILMCVCMALGFAACGGTECAHTYDNACDTTCNECGETREISHTPEADDGDCTTAIKCANCDKEAVAGNVAHSATDTDGDRKCDNPGCEQLIIIASEGLAFAQNTDEDGNLLESYSVTGIGECTDTDIVIPATYGDENYPVTAIAESAFDTDFEYNAACFNLTSVNIPDSVTEIALGAFYGCSSLKSVNFPDSVETIGIWAFGRTALTSVTFGANSKLEMNGNSAFYECTALTSVNIPDSVETIDVAAFESTALTSVTFGENSRLKTIAGRAFNNCSALKSVTIPTSVTTIGNGAFADTGLTSVTIPDSVTKIDMLAFAYTGLTSVMIPASVTTIGNDAFYMCYSLTSVYYGGTQDEWTSFSVSFVFSTPTVYFYSSDMPTAEGNYWRYENGAPTAWDNPYNPVEVDGLKFKLNDGGESYSVTGLATGFEGTVLNIPATCNGKPVTAIGKEAFQDCESLTSVTIPDSVTTIGEGAFNYCRQLTSVTFGANSQLKTIGMAAFDSCSSLECVTIPNSVETIGKEAFSYTALKSVTIPDFVTTIGDYAFYRCTALASVTIPASVEIIGKEAFRECTSLASVTIPASVTEIGYNTFYGCENLASVTFDANSKLTTIGEGAFKKCTALTSVNIPDSVTSIGKVAFDGCSSLTSVTFGEDSELKTLSERAFSYTALKSVTIPASVTEIGVWAFYSCTDLKSVTIPASVTEIGYGAFEFTALTSIYYGGTEADWGDEDKITIGNKAIPTNATVYYYLKNVPDTTVNYWSYVDGVPTALKFIETEQINFALNADEKSYSVKGLKDGFEGEILIIPATYGEENYPVTAIAENAFSGWDNPAYLNLVSVTIPASVETIGDRAFVGRNEMDFSLVSKLTSVIFEANSKLTTIGQESFFGCSVLTSMTIPSSVTTIGVWAFDWCYALTSVTIPASVTEIGADAFSTALTSVYYGGTEVDWDGIAIGNGAIPTNATVYYYSENKPEGEGNYWHYVDGVPAKWEN